MIRPTILRHLRSDGIVIICSHTDFLLTQTNIIIELSFGSRTTRLKHEIVAVIETQTTTEHMPTLVVVAVETFHRTPSIAVESDAIVSIVHTFR